MKKLQKKTFQKSLHTIFLFSATLLVPSNNYAQIINTFAGSAIQGFSGDGGQATNAEMLQPFSVAVDKLGNVYIADQNNYRIRVVNTSGIITTIAGIGYFGFSGDGGAATSAEISYPDGLGIDSIGDVYFTDEANQRIRKIDTKGIISTYAGNGIMGYSGNGGAATSAELWHPNGNVVIDPSGNILFTEYGNCVLRMVNTKGIISTLAGNGIAGYSGDGGQATLAELNSPYTIALAVTGDMFIADDINNVVRKINTSGIISTFAGNGKSGYTGNGEAATNAELNQPTGVALDASGNLFICEQFNSIVRKVNTSNIISLVAGNGTAGFFGDGGPATLAELNYPNVIAIDLAGNLYISDQDNSRIRYFPNTLKISGSGGGTCKNSCEGTVKATPNGGNPPYTYLWSNGETSQIDTGLCIGVYSVTVTDHSGNKITISDTVNPKSSPTVSLNYQSNDTVCSAAGTITLFGSPNGGIYGGSAVHGNFFYPDSAQLNKNNLITYSYTNSYGCTSSITDSLYVRTCLGIAPSIQGESRELEIESNPASSQFTLILNKPTGKITVSLYNIIGKEVMQQSYSQQQTITENTSGLAPGIYIIKVQTEDGTSFIQKLEIAR